MGSWLWSSQLSRGLIRSVCTNYSLFFYKRAKALSACDYRIEFMSEIQLNLACAGSQKEGSITLEEEIAASKLALAVQASLGLADSARQMETVHICLNGDGIALVDGAVGHGYSAEGGTLAAVVAVSREANATADIEIGLCTFANFPTFTKISASAPLVMAGAQKIAGVLTTWDTAIPAGSHLQAKQVSSSPANAIIIDVYLVILH